MSGRGWTPVIDLTGKVAVVTGAATGVGRGIAVCLAKLGARVAVVYHHRPPEATLAAIGEANGRAVALPAVCCKR